MGTAQRTLVIDSATEACSVALFDGAALIAGDWQKLGRGHAERLVPMIAALPGNGRADRIVVALGPGSFTGVRVGLAAARALGFAWGAPVLGYSTLALVAAMARDLAGAEAAAGIDVAMTGGHGEWFVESHGPDGAPGLPLSSLPPEEAASTCRNLLVAGSQARALVERRGFGTALDLLPDARCFALLPATALLTDTSPLYGRAPDARLPATAVRTATQPAQ
ncbi:tRNA (adenosine(37)-N6)-threonylcarbamoyltransferase complex dimerization subunit type 1 TsaB [Novosphingobium colocasiae]|uniref:tRNA (adenosine(37)-N6)-threonylcarbamoyltransferase complex dimerization subunit type 1 TsaB n=1 Tax=Novosphingobium colocasiae TaxID=1256513 RepID=UPI0035B1F21E